MSTRLVAHGGGIVLTSLLLATVLAAWRHGSAGPSAVAECFVMGSLALVVVLSVTTIPTLLPLALLDTTHLMRWPGEGSFRFAFAYAVGLASSLGLAVLILGFPGLEATTWIAGILLVQGVAATATFAVLHRSAFVTRAAACLSALPPPQV